MLSARSPYPLDVPENELTTVSIAIKRKQDCALQGAGREAVQFTREAIRNAGRTAVFIDLLTLARLDVGFEVHLATAGLGQVAVTPEVLTAAVERCDRWSALVVTVPDLPTQGRALAALVAMRDRIAAGVPVVVLTPASPMAIRAVLGRTLASVQIPVVEAAPARPAVLRALGIEPSRVEMPVALSAQPAEPQPLIAAGFTAAERADATPTFAAPPVMQLASRQIGWVAPKDAPSGPAVFTTAPVVAAGRSAESA